METKFNSSLSHSFEIVDNNYSIWKLPKNIKTYTEMIDKCPECGMNVVFDYTLLPVSTNENVKIPGYICKKCKSIYVDHNFDLKSLMENNVFAKEFTLDNMALWNISEVRKQKELEERQRKKIEKKRKENREKFFQKIKKLEMIPSSEILISVRYKNGNINEIIIVKDISDADPDNNVFHYLSDAGREFISAAYAKERNRQGIYQGKEYRTISRPLYKDVNCKTSSDNRLPVDLMIRADGGYSSSVVNNNYEIVDLFLYSPLNQRYEVIKATHDKLNGGCFVDISKYRKFVHANGKPGLLLCFETKMKSIVNYDNLHDESVLRSYGYTVNQTDNLPAKYRQELLAEIVDLEILKVSQIVRFLDFLIRSRQHQPMAQIKWIKDKEYIENYKVNPTRFLIAKGL